MNEMQIIKRPNRINAYPKDITKLITLLNIPLLIFEISPPIFVERVEQHINPIRIKNHCSFNKKIVLELIKLLPFNPKRFLK